MTAATALELAADNDRQVAQQALEAANARTVSIAGQIIELAAIVEVDRALLKDSR